MVAHCRVAGSFLVSSDLWRSCMGSLWRPLIRLRRRRPRSGTGRTAELTTTWLIQLSTVAVRIIAQGSTLKKEQEEEKSVRYMTSSRHEHKPNFSVNDPKMEAWNKRWEPGIWSVILAVVGDPVFRQFHFVCLFYLTRSLWWKSWSHI